MKVKIRRLSVYEVEFPNGEIKRMERVGCEWNGMMELRCDEVGSIVIDSSEKGLQDVFGEVFDSNIAREAAVIKGSPMFLAMLATKSEGDEFAAG